MVQAFSYRIFGCIAALYFVVHFGTTTLHVYHVCLENDIISDYNPKPGLGIPGYLNLLFIDGRTDDVTLMTSAHQLSEIFYKTCVLDGSDIHRFKAVLSQTKHVIQVDCLTIHNLVKRVRPKFRKLHELIVFFEREIFAFVFQDSKTYGSSYGTEVEINRKFKIYDEFLRQKRSFASDLLRKTTGFMNKARKWDNDASTVIAVCLFCSAYSTIFFVFVNRNWRYFLSCVITFVAIYSLCLTIDYWRRADEFRAKAERETGVYNDILEEVKTKQDCLFRSRNISVTNFVKAADDRHEKQVFLILRLFTKIMKHLQWIDLGLQRMMTLAGSLEMNKNVYEGEDILQDKSRQTMKNLRTTLRNITSNIDRIFHLMK